MATLTVHIVFGGTLYRTENGTTQATPQGHMFFELSGQSGQSNDSWGFQPSGVVPGEAQLYYRRDVSISFDISDSQAQAIRDFSTKAEEEGFGQWMPGNTCVDFTWAAMREAGVTIADTWNPLTIFPGYNVERLKDTYYEYLRRPEFNRELKGIDPNANATYNAAATYAADAPAPIRRDPLTLDLDGDGLETVGIDSTNPIFFDHEGNGLKTATGWVAPDDAFLVLDRNGNGTIDNGTELFGDSTPLYAGGKAADGFAALAQEDTNGDGLVDASDARFANLRLWRDLNQNGTSETNELFTLASQNIAALKIAKTEHALYLPDGNVIADLGGYIRADGSDGAMGVSTAMADIDLVNNPFYSQYTDTLPISEQAQALPQMQGSGWVRSLREAASQSPELAARLAEYAAATTKAEQQALLHGVVKAWAATSEVATTGDDVHLYQYGWKWVEVPPNPGGWARTSYEIPQDSEAHQQIVEALAIVEAFNGQIFPAHSFWTEQLGLLDQCVDAIETSVYQGLLLQTRLKPYLDEITLYISENGITLNYDGLAARLDALRASDPTNAAVDLVELVRYAGRYLEGWNGAGEIAAWLESADADRMRAVLTAEGNAWTTPGQADGGAGKVDALVLEGINLGDIGLEKAGADLYIINDSGERIRFGRGKASNWKWRKAA